VTRTLVIVESPAKAKTIAGFLGDDFTVEASVGHIRDLAVRSTLPDAERGEPWAEYGVDIYGGFKPRYVLNDDKRSKVRELRALMKDADELLLATDEDREGEAISWHLLEELRPRQDMTVRRMVFHEITPEAIEAALASPREIDQRLVDAQETRRILDRLYGWDAGRVVRKVVTNRGSAGRVQSVATRIVVERERERMAFRSADYWGLDADLARTDGDVRSFRATLVALEGARVARGADFDDQGRTTREVHVLDEATATRLGDELRSAPVAVAAVERKPYRRSPAAPFTTSTFQQEAGRKLRFTAQRAMRAAQGLYERGYITYMRTDSTTLSGTALAAARAEIAERFGAAYLPDAPRTYAKKAKNAQEAHEAIRPAGETFRHPDQVAGHAEVNADMAAAYRMIWQRTVASQMTDATGETVTVRFRATPASWTEAELSTSGTVIAHQGFKLAYVEDRDEDDAEDDERERQLPAMAEGDALEVREVHPAGHATKPPARYTEASLVKRMEELGVGRPSTYASTIGTIIERGYVWKKGSALVPTWLAFAVTRLMEEYFGELVDYQFTARMEDDLDEIAGGRAEMVPWLSEFYWGDGAPVPPGVAAPGGLRRLADDFDETDIRPVIRRVNATTIGADPDGVAIEVYPGKQGGPYLKRGDDTASVPEDLPPDELTVEKALELLAMPREGRLLGDDPASGLPVYAKAGRFGPYVQLGEYDKDSKDKPRAASLFKTMTVERVTLDEALELLTLPRTVGTDPDDGGVVTAANGRFGPYLQKELADGTKDTRSLENEEQLLTVTMDEARALFAQPKRRRGQRAPAAPLKELGADPDSGAVITLREGRFGPYVTDGETNASLRVGDDPETITPERAVELLVERRAKLAAGGGRKKKAAKKKAAKKKATKKSAAKKSAARKSAATTKAGAKKAAPARPGGDER
jgi:DNA topoisomerase-1